MVAKRRSDLPTPGGPSSLPTFLGILPPTDSTVAAWCWSIAVLALTWDALGRPAPHVVIRLRARRRR